ncbi:MAG: Fic family protein [Candidatus Baltobacteraceae bacterium]
MKTFLTDPRAAARCRGDVELWQLVERLRGLPVGRGRRDEERRLVAEEIHASARLAGAALDPVEVRALVERGQALGEHRLVDYLIVVGYADAAAWIAGQAAVGDRRGHAFLKLDEIADLHARVGTPLDRRTGARPREVSPWRSTAHSAFADGMISPPPWLINFELTAFVERFAHGPTEGESPAKWVAAALERFTRIQPFAFANGRVARLVVNLLLRRLGLPPFAVAPRDAARFRAALRQADSSDLGPLAALLTRVLVAGLARLVSASDPDQQLVRLTEAAAPRERAAFYKAAQRGRLRTVRRGSELLTTHAWIEEYRAIRPQRLT